MEFNLNTLTIQNIPYFNNGLTVVVQRRDIKTKGGTWFNIGVVKRLLQPEYKPTELLPSKLLVDLQHSLEVMNHEETVITLMTIGDYMAGWLHTKDLESKNA